MLFYVDMHIKDLSKTFGFKLTSYPKTVFDSESKIHNNFPDCGVLPGILNGSVDLSNGTAYLSTVLYSCDIGYYIVGNSTRTCAADGLWNQAEPFCQIHGENMCFVLVHVAVFCKSFVFPFFNIMFNY